MPIHKKNPPKPELPVAGWPRPYLRDGVPGLPIERQAEMLGALGLDLTNEKMLYIDNLSRAKIKARAPLPERDAAINPRHHGETVYIASLRVLGWDHLDVNRALVTADKAEAKVYCADVGQVIAADTPPGELLQMLIRSEEARRRARVSRAIDGQLSRRAKRLKEGLAIARPLWTGPMTVKQIAEASGLSTRTLYTYLPPRNEMRDEEKNGKKHS
jgi:hypothetical protein